MTDDPTTAGPLGEAGARLRALVAEMRKYADDIHYRDAARIREWVTKLDALLSAPVVSGWQPIASAPKDGAAFRAYAPSLIHADFNPHGSVEAVFDGERFTCAEWDGCHDVWNTRFLPDDTTHWMPLPAAPIVTQEGEEPCP